eukprot:TRINITY_DN3973_c0_g1_i5.p2 TRINITY_DN3973_c0_g1~~TRINITY_DN3973_c0_g1_i5.p2  ORF type:complete len:373 (+),score=64.72 TRINITY_DN3973_c0_g1_i5:36-1121(+)
MEHHGSNPNTQAVAHCFAVADVVADPQCMFHGNLELEEALPLKDRTFESGESNLPLAKIDYPANAFVGAIVTAYNQHLPLGLTADDVWLPVAQGISIYVADNSEECRDLFVGHEGQLELTVSVDKYGITPGSRGNREGWPLAVRDMVGLMGEHLKGDLAQVMTAPFSTTGPVELTAFRCTMMHGMQEYFKYRMSCTLCGIPSVTLYGKAEDYEAVLSRAERFAGKLPGLGWWFDRLLPQLRKIVDSARGSPDGDWWNRAFSRIGGGSGASYMCGWVTDFIPFTCNGQIWEPAKIERGRGIDFGKLTPAILQTPFVLDYYGEKIPMHLLSGFVGIHQDPVDGTVRPAIGWATVRTGPVPAKA